MLDSDTGSDTRSREGGRRDGRPTAGLFPKAVRVNRRNPREGGFY